MKRKPLEGIEALLFTLGAGLGYILAPLALAWWINLVIVMLTATVFERLVKYLRNKNNKINV